MKKMHLANGARILAAGSMVAAMAAVMMAPSAAQAAPQVTATVDLSGITQVTNSETTQKAAGIDIVVGDVTGSATSQATNALQVADLTKTLDTEGSGQAPSGLGVVGALDVSSVNQDVQGATKQAALAITGSGTLNGVSQSLAAATNVTEDANVQVNVTTRR